MKVHIDLTPCVAQATSARALLDLSQITDCVWQSTFAELRNDSPSGDYAIGIVPTVSGRAFFRPYDANGLRGWMASGEGNTLRTPDSFGRITRIFWFALDEESEDFDYVGHSGERGPRQSYVEARLNAASDNKKESIEANFRLGRHYLKGKGCERDEGKALKHLQKAAEEEHGEALNQLGRCYANGIAVLRDPGAAFQYFSLAAKAGSQSGQVNLGRCHFYGIGTPVNYEMAFACFLQGADAGDRRALIHLGTCYQLGRGTPKDLKKAFKYFRRGRKQPNTGLVYLGLCYAEGVGTERNIEKALKCFIRSRNPLAEALRFLIYTTDPEARNERAADSMRRQLAEKNWTPDPDFMDLLGGFFLPSQLRGFGSAEAVPPAAEELASETADAELQPLQVNLEPCVENGVQATGCLDLQSLDPQTGRPFAELASANRSIGYPIGVQPEVTSRDGTISFCFSDGFHLWKKLNQRQPESVSAVFWYALEGKGDQLQYLGRYSQDTKAFLDAYMGSASQDSRLACQALETLGDCYARGRGVRKNRAKAKFCFHKAAERSKERWPGRVTARNAVAFRPASASKSNR